MAYFSSFSSVYDDFTRDVDYQQRADYICSVLSDFGIKDGLMLDAGCGTGTLTAEFCKRGFEVTGVDNSPDMLSEAQKKLAAFGDSALLLCQDLTELDLYGTVDCVVCSLDTVNHITDKDDVIKMFSGISLFMNPGGIFVFDVNTVYKHINVLADNTFVYENENSFLVWQCFPEEDNACVSYYIDIFSEDDDGRYLRSQEEFSERAYSENELTSMLSQCGFSVENIFADMKKEKPGTEEERIYIVAKKI